MAQINVSGVSECIADLDRLISNAPMVCSKMVEAAADVVEPAIVSAAGSDMGVRSGRLVGSIGRKKKRTGGGPSIKIGPTGVHHTYLPRHSSGVTMASYLGYIYEYGAARRHILGRKWLQKAVKRSASAAYAAEEKVFNESLK